MQVAAEAGKGQVGNVVGLFSDFGMSETTAAGKRAGIRR